MASPLFKRNREPLGPLDYSRRLSLRLVFVATLVFLYLPIITLMIFSFNDSRRNIIWRGFTTKYYKKLLGCRDEPLLDCLSKASEHGGVFDGFFELLHRKANDGSVLEAFINSLTIAFISTLIAVLLGAMVAVLLWRFRFPAKAPYEGAMALPIVIPEICMGVAMLAFFNRVGWPTDLPWPLNLSSITIAHVSFSFPFAAMVIRARLVNFNRELEEAAKDLGASEWQTFRDILIPFMKPGLVAGGLLAFTLSLDDFVITFFTSGPDTVTFPVKVYSMVRFSVTPEVNAASAVLIVITIALTATAMWLQNRAQRK